MLIIIIIMYMDTLQATFIKDVTFKYDNNKWHQIDMIRPLLTVLLHDAIHFRQDILKQGS